MPNIKSVERQKRRRSQLLTHIAIIIGISSICSVLISFIFMSYYGIDGLKKTSAEQTSRISELKILSFEGADFHSKISSLQSKIDAQQKQIEALVSELSRVRNEIVGKEKEIQTKLKEVEDKFQSQVSTFQQKLEIKVERLLLEQKTIEGGIRAQEGQISTINKSITSLNSRSDGYDTRIKNLTESSLTGIRLVDYQRMEIWNGPGYPDSLGWVITGIANHNNDGAPDYVQRRRIEKQVAGRWMSL